MKSFIVASVLALAAADNAPAQYRPAPTYAPARTYQPAPTYAPARTYQPAPTYAPARTYKPAQTYAPAYDEPANYQFAWAVNDDYSGVVMGQDEARNGYSTNGQYNVLLPDGRTQTVTYTVADDYSGYVADVQYSGYAQPASYKPAPTYAPARTYKPAPTYAPARTYKPAPTYAPARTYKPAPTYAPAKPTYN